MSINNQGVIIGVYDLSPSDPFRGFMWKAGAFSNLNPPDSGGHSLPEKISNAGDVVGTYTFHRRWCATWIFLRPGNIHQN